MKRKSKIKIIRIVVTIIAITALIGLIAYLLPIIKDISTEEGQLAFRDKVNQLGIWGVLLLFALEVAQIFLIVLPGEPLEVLAGICYGSIGGSIFIFVSVLLTTMVIFFLVQKLGRKFVIHFFDANKIYKIENSKLFQNPKKVEWIMILLFLIPGTPKDLLVYIGGLLPIRPWRFILISTFARFPSVISSTIAGANLAMGEWQNMIWVYGITFLITGIIIGVINIFDKDKTTKDALETIK